VLFNSKFKIQDSKRIQGPSVFANGCRPASPDKKSKIQGESFSRPLVLLSQAAEDAKKIKRIVLKPEKVLIFLASFASLREIDFNASYEMLFILRSVFFLPITDH